MSGHVLVTGASGFVGRDLVVRLARAGWQVRAAARNPATVPQAAAIEPAQLPDLSQRADWSGLVAGVTHIVHLAAIAHSTRTIAEATYTHVNAQAVLTLAKAAREAGVRRVVLMSSVRAQCGPYARDLLIEARTPAPEDAYGRTKLAGERHLAEALAGASTDWCILRPCVVYGPHVKGNMAALLKLARTSWPLPLGALAAKRSLLGLPNLAAAVEHALTQASVSRRTFLLADPEPLTVPQIVAAMREGQGHAPRVFSLPLTPARVAAIAVGQRGAWDRIAGDLVISTAALEASGWVPRENARDGIIRWMRES